MDVEKLRVAIGMRRSFLRLAIALEAVLLQVQLLRYGRVAHGVSLCPQFPRKVARALACPAQATDRIPALRRLDPRIKIR